MMRVTIIGFMLLRMMKYSLEPNAEYWHFAGHLNKKKKRGRPRSL